MTYFYIFFICSGTPKTGYKDTKIQKRTKKRKVVWCHSKSHDYMDMTLPLFSL